MVVLVGRVRLSVCQSVQSQQTVASSSLSQSFRRSLARSRRDLIKAASLTDDAGTPRRHALRRKNDPPSPVFITSALTAVFDALVVPPWSSACCPRRQPLEYVAEDFYRLTQPTVSKHTVKERSGKNDDESTWTTGRVERHSVDRRCLEYWNGRSCCGSWAMQSIRHGR